MARSKPGIAFSSICHLSVMRFTFKTGSDGSLNVARPRSVELEPDPRVKTGSNVAASTERGATGSLASLHPIRSPAQTSAPRRDVRAGVNETGVTARRCIGSSGTEVDDLFAGTAETLWLSPHLGFTSLTT